MILAFSILSLSLNTEMHCCLKSRDLFILHIQYHYCWSPGDAGSQGISCNGSLTVFSFITTGVDMWIFENSSIPGFTRAAQFYFWPADYLPLHFGLIFVNPSYIYTRACDIIYMYSLYHSVHKSTINNANLWKIGWEIFSWKYWFEHLFGD